jgi:hypothetical protein
MTWPCRRAPQRTPSLRRGRPIQLRCAPRSRSGRTRHTDPRLDQDPRVHPADVSPNFRRRPEVSGRRAGGRSCGGDVRGPDRRASQRARAVLCAAAPIYAGAAVIGRARGPAADGEASGDRGSATVDGARGRWMRVRSPLRACRASLRGAARARATGLGPRSSGCLLALERGRSQSRRCTGAAWWHCLSAPAFRNRSSSVAGGSAVRSRACRSTSSPDRPSGWWESRAAASRRSHGASSGCIRSTRGRSASTGASSQHWTGVRCGG